MALSIPGVPSVPSKVTNWSTRIRCENFSRLRLKTLELCQWRCSSISIVLTVNIYQTSNCWLRTGKRLLGSYWKDKHISKLDRVYLSNLLTNSIYTYTITTLRVNQWKIFRWSLLQTLIQAKKTWLTFKMTSFTFVFLQILFTGRLIRSYSA